MRHISSNAIVAIVIMTAQVLLAQTRIKPTTPGSSDDPAWQSVVRLPDGRTFVTDGGLAIDVAFAKPAQLPTRELPPKVTYINFLRRTLPARSVRFRMNGGMQPVVIVASGTAVGVLMPVKQ
jgi:hypothetical protein